MRVALLTVIAVAAAAVTGAPTLEPGPRYGRVLLPDGAALEVELADTPAKRARGYMFRDAVGPEDGMLFLLGEAAIHPFWMKNVRVPLDILWLGQDGTIVHLAPEVPPCRADPCASVVPPSPASLVLELAGGRAQALGLGAGMTLVVLVPPAD